MLIFCRIFLSNYIRFLPSTITEKNAPKNILDGRKDGRMDRRTEVKQYTTPPPSGAGV
jgi:hypothetical protein